MQVQTDARVGLAVGAEHRREGREHGRADKADVERADFAAAYTAGLVEVALDVAEGAAGALEEGLAGGCECYGTRGAEEERVAEKLFEATDLLRERRLGEVETLGGAAEVELFGYGDEVAEVAELDLGIHTCRIIIELNKILDVLRGRVET